MELTAGQVDARFGARAPLPASGGPPVGESVPRDEFTGLAEPFRAEAREILKARGANPTPQQIERVALALFEQTLASAPLEAVVEPPRQDTPTEVLRGLAGSAGYTGALAASLAGIPASLTPGVLSVLQEFDPKLLWSPGVSLAEVNQAASWGSFKTRSGTELRGVYKPVERQNLEGALRELDNLQPGGRKLLKAIHLSTYLPPGGSAQAGPGEAVMSRTAVLNVAQVRSEVFLAAGRELYRQSPGADAVFGKGVEDFALTHEWMLQRWERIQRFPDLFLHASGEVGRKAGWILEHGYQDPPPEPSPALRAALEAVDQGGTPFRDRAEFEATVRGMLDNWDFYTPPEDPKQAFVAAILQQPEPEVQAAERPRSSIRNLHEGEVGFLGRCVRAAVGLGNLLMGAVSHDPLKVVRQEMEQVNALEKPLQAEIKARAEELRKAGGTGNLELEAARQVLQGKTAEFRQRLKDGARVEDLKIEAFAVAREAARLTVKMRPYDVQIMGGLAATQGRIAEMKTGEGKTLTAIMPAFLYGLTGKGCHLVTVNDYLVKRDFEWMRPALEFLGLTVGCVHEGVDTEGKKRAYAADVTYVTNHSLGFDFLRDEMERDPSRRVQREPFFALVDEVDEILIDEARTPLILSALAQAAGDEHRTFDRVVKMLDPGTDFRTNRKEHQAYLTEEGTDRVEAILAAQAAAKDLVQAIANPAGYAAAVQRALAAQRLLKAQTDSRLAPEEGSAERLEQAKSQAPTYDLWSRQNLDRVFFLENAVKANALFDRDKNYMVTRKGVEIIDEFKGRTMEGRRYTSGLHQALEAKEGANIQPYQRTIASITYPDLFRRYPHLAGWSGTAMTDAAEFMEQYNLEVVPIPTNKPSQLKTEHDVVFRTMKEKLDAVADHVEELFRAGKPVLVGTRSIPVNRYLSALLSQRGIPHQVLNAQSVQGNTEEENAIIAEAGRSGMVTIATNMAGRGVDIKPDYVNYKLMAIQCYEDTRAGKQVIVDLDTDQEAHELVRWLEQAQIPHEVTSDASAVPSAGKVVVRVGVEQKAPEGATQYYFQDARFQVDPGWFAKIAGRIEPDLVNYKMLAVESCEAWKKGRPVVVDVATEEDARRLQEWYAVVADHPDYLGLKVKLVRADEQALPGQILLRVGVDAPPAPGVEHMSGSMERFQSGGLHVLGTERHEARRIDLQLQGRAARQGNPGYCRFYLSLEDELLRHFGGSNLGRFFDDLGIPPGQGICHPWLDKLINKAQETVESVHREVRKNTTKYGKILNKQREVFLSDRRKFVDGLADQRELLIQWGARSLAHEAFDWKVQRDAKPDEELEVPNVPRHLKPDDLKAALAELAGKYGLVFDIPVDRKVTQEKLAELLEPIVRRAHEEAARNMPEWALDKFQRKAVLDVVDAAWMDHLENMEALQTGIGFEAYAQKDPYISFQSKAFDLYQDLLTRIEVEAGSFVLKEMLQASRQLQQIAAATARTVSELRSLADRIESGQAGPGDISPELRRALGIDDRMLESLEATSLDGPETAAEVTRKRAELVAHMRQVAASTERGPQWAAAPPDVPQREPVP
ncbi:MAG: hypothetical protein AB1758_09570 [Candidatus Eremiobacterota bacterium]